MTKNAYSEWLSSLDPTVAREIDQSVVRITGSALPSRIMLHGTKDQIAAIEPEVEYVVEPGRWCRICEEIVLTIVWRALIRWVLDPLGDPLELLWEEWWGTICGHEYGDTQEWDTTGCPYQLACMGTWQRVIYDDGVREMRV